MKLRYILWFILCFFQKHETLLALVNFSSNGINLKTASSWMELTPTIQFDLQEWVSPLDCKQLDQNTSHCSLKEHGFIQIKRAGNQIKLSFYADKDTYISGIGLKGLGMLPGAHAMLSNGAQSWSQSGIISIPSKAVTPSTLNKALKALDQKEEHRKGYELSWNHSFIQGEREAFLLGAVDASVFRTWIQAYQIGKKEHVYISVKSGGISDKRFVRSGQLINSDPFYITISDDLAKDLRIYGKSIPSSFSNTQSTPDIGWNSWYQHFADVAQDDIARSASHLPQFLQESFKHFQIKTNQTVIYIDDGWEKEWGVWEVNSKFSKGLANIAKDINQLGFKAGIWLAPLLHRKNGPVPQEHPDWFIREQVYPHASGDYRILDVTHPDAANFLKSTIESLVESGFTHLKIDFLIAGLFPGKRYLEVTALDAYHMAMKMLRDAAGPKAHLLACGAPLLPSIKYVDSWRIGPDIAFEFPAKQKGSSWVDVANQARNIGARWFLCESIHCDADPVLLRGPREARFKSASWVASLTGGGLFLSDDLSKLNIDKWLYSISKEMLSQAVSGKPARPNPLVPKNLPRYLEAPSMRGRIFGDQFIPAPNRWQTASGQTLLINFNSKPLLGPDGSYLNPRESRLYN